MILIEVFDNRIYLLSSVVEVSLCHNHALALVIKAHSFSVEQALGEESYLVHFAGQREQSAEPIQFTIFKFTLSNCLQFLCA